MVGLTVLLCTSISESKDIIYWSEDQPLTWEDFAGKPIDNHHDFSALTSSGIVHYKGCKNGKIIYKVRAYFERNESWVKTEGRTDYHLSHEQIHFDITELYARKLRKELASRNFVCGQEEQFETFISNFQENWGVEQQNYDIHTKHSLEHDHQKSWYHRIKMELSLLKEFKEIEVKQ